jgi:hypothetical protein
VKALGNSVFSFTKKALDGWQVLADGGDAAAQALIKEANMGSKVASSVTAALGSVGAIAEVVGAVVQIGTSAAAYAQQAQFNVAFQGAIQAANQPVTISDLQSMLSGSSPEMPAYLSAYLSTGPAGVSQTFNANQPTQSLNGILSITTHF